MKFLKSLHDLEGVFNVVNFFDKLAAQINFHNIKMAGALGKVAGDIKVTGYVIKIY